ncbi:MAG TPA: xylosidase, partial [Cytophagales bacterium]|nr:xylosidase [Cytophagales bacterium]
PQGTRKEMIWLDSDRFGWQRFGEHMDNTFLDAFIEGAHVTKHNKKYYLQFGAPGTEFSGYADGVAMSDAPLGPYEWQSDPLSIKLGGFARGAGHGSTFQDNKKNYWHVSTIQISVKNTFERRIGIWPAGFDKDDVMWCSTAFGDYPHFLPDAEKPSEFSGWMLLNYAKPITVSSTYANFTANKANDEDMKTYWSAATGNAGEWIQTDLGNVSTVNAIQINYADQDVDQDRLGKRTDQFHQYKLFYSLDGKKWTLLVDKSQNKTDVPHEYVELTKPVQARFIKLENVHMPTGKFAISGLRVFGNGNSAKPENVKDFIVLRTEKDKRSAFIKWRPISNAYAYNLYYGTAPDKLYTCIMVMEKNDYWLKTMDKTKTYYFTIEAINENGRSENAAPVKAE